MKNIDRMKRHIIKQIENMTVDQFENFLDMLTGDYNFEKSPIDTKDIFMCDNCKEIYGECPKDTYDNQICTDRFIDYALREAE